MAIDFKTTEYKGMAPAIWRGEAKILPGSFSLSQTFPAGTTIYRGVPVHADWETMSAAIVKIARVVSGGDTSKPRITKGSYFQVGDTVMSLTNTEKSPIITKIDTSNNSYDVLELSGAITGLAENDFIQEATPYAAAEGESPELPAAPKYAANSVVGAILEIQVKGLPALDLAYEAAVLRNAVAPFPDDWLIENGPCLKANPNIIYIKQ